MRALFGSFASLGLLALLVVPAASGLAGCDSGGDEGPSCTDPVAFDIEDITPDSVDTGDQVADGACVSVSYVGRLAGGAEFDRGTGLRFAVRQNGGVINGFWLGVRQQRVGETRRLTIPPSLGYLNREVTGADGEVVIPACSVLEFEVTVDDILASSACQRF